MQVEQSLLEYVAISAIVISVVVYLISRLTQDWIVSSEILYLRWVAWLMSIGAGIGWGFYKDYEIGLDSFFYVFSIVVIIGILNHAIYYWALKDEPINLRPADRNNSGDTDGKG